MSPDSPKTPREELQVRLTALLLGELSDEEATALRQAMEQDAELRQLHERLKQTIGLVREAASVVEEGTLAQTPALKLSGERRKNLLARFKAVPPKQTAKRLRRIVVRGRKPAALGDWLKMAAMVAALLALGGLLVSNRVRKISAPMEMAEAGRVRLTGLSSIEGARREIPLTMTPVTQAASESQPAPASYALEGARADLSLVQPRAEFEARRPIAGGDTLAKQPDRAGVPTRPARTPTPASAPSVNEPTPAASDSKQYRARVALPELSAAQPADGLADANGRSSSEWFGGNQALGERQSGTGFGGGGIGGVGGGSGPALFSRDGRGLVRGGGFGGGGGGAANTPGSSGIRAAKDPLAQSDFQEKAVEAINGSARLNLELRDKSSEPSRTANEKEFAGIAFLREGRADFSPPMNGIERPTSPSQGVAWGNFDNHAFFRQIPPLTSPAAPPADPNTGLSVAPAGPAAGGAGYGLANGNVVAAGKSLAMARDELGLAGWSAPKLDAITPPATSQPYSTESKLNLNYAFLDPTRETAAKPSPTPQRALRGFYDDAAQVAAGEQLFRKSEPAKEAKAEGRELAELKKLNVNADGLDHDLRISPDAAKPGLQTLGVDAGRYAMRLEDMQRTKDNAPTLGDQPVIGQAFDSERLLESRSETGQKPSEERKQTAEAEAALNRRVEIALPEQTREANAALAGESFGAHVASAPTVGSKDHYNFAEVAPNKPAEKSEPLAARGDAVAPTLEPESLGKLDGSRIEAQARYEGLNTLHSQLTNLSSTDFGKVIQTASPDPEFIGLLEKLSETEVKLATVAKNRGPEEAEVRELTRMREQINKQVEERRAGILKGLKAKLDSEQKRLAEPSVPQLTDEDRVKRSASTVPTPQPEATAAENPFSTFSLNVSDVSFKLAAASLERGAMPEPATVRSEEFINAFDYRDPEPSPGVPIAFAWERARYPFAHNRDLVRFSVKTAASGRQPGRPLNLVLLLDNSGSMERADRVRIIQECLRVLASQLQPQDRVSVVSFSRTARLWVDGLPGSQAHELMKRVGGLTPQGGTNLEEAMNLAYQTALRHYLAHGVNRVVLLTDGAANLGDVEPESLKKKVEAHRKQGIALDCFGIGWEGYQDDLLEVLSRNGDGRYGFVNTPGDAVYEFAGQLAGALRVAASDVKVQVEFNPRRVTAYRQIGYAKHQLTKEQFRDNTVDAAEIGAAEAGNALYAVQVNPRGEGPLGVVRVRFKVPGTTDYREHEWPVPYTGASVSLEQSSAAMRLAAVASGFSEWLVSSPFAGEVTPDRLLGYLSGVPETCGADPRPKKLEWMIRQAKSVVGK